MSEEVKLADFRELVAEKKDTGFARGLIERCEADILAALNYEMISSPRGGPMTMPSFMAAVNLEVASNERLGKAMRASPASFVKSVMLAAQCKLLVGNAYDLFYLIPRWNKKLGCEEVTPLIGYKGLCELAQRHPRVHKVDAVLVYEGEEFHYDAGAGKLRHIVNLLGDRSMDKVIGGYARVVITEPASSHPVLDDPVIHVMSRAEIDSVMKRSDAYQNAEKKGWRNSPWHTDWKPMARKTLLRAVMNGGAVPKDMGLGGALHQDDEADTTIRVKPASLPRQSAVSDIRQSLGIDEKMAPFDFAEEAVQAIMDADTIDMLNALRDRWQHFEGVDATTIAEAFEDKMDELTKEVSDG